VTFMGPAAKTITVAGGETFGSMAITNGSVIIGAGNKVTMGAGGSITATAPGNLAGGADGGLVEFMGSGTASGVTFNDVTLDAGFVDFGVATCHVTGVMTMTCGRVADGSSLNYDGSTIVYGACGALAIAPGRASGPTTAQLAGTAATLGNEWQAGTSGPGVPYNVSISSSVTLDFGSASARTARGGVRIGTGAGLTLSSAPGGDLAVAGDWTNAGAFSPNGRTVTFNGPAPQTITSGGAPFDAVTLTNPAGLVLAGDLTVNSTLAMNGGNITTGTGNAVVIGPSGTVTHSSGQVVGNLEKPAGTGTNVTLTYEVGDPGNLTPVTLVFGTVTTAGTVTVTSTTGDHPDLAASIIDPARGVNRYWTVTNGGIAFDQCAATFGFASGDLDPGADPARFLVGKRDGTRWTHPTVGTRTANSIQATGLASFSDFVVGEQMSSGVITPEPAAGACISSAHSCIAVPVVFRRTDTTPVRGYSVTFALDGGLTLCAPQVTSGGYLRNPLGPYLVANPDGSYSLDESTAGFPCDATNTGTLFTLHVTSLPGTGAGTITITSLRVRGCDNTHLAVSIGSPASIPIDFTAAPATGVTATQVRQGNDADGTTKIRIEFVSPADGSSVEIYRAAYGSYPEYDGPPSPGSVPPVPPGPRWVATGLTTSPADDEPATRDFWYYTAKSADACGNVAWSDMTSGTLNYHLGDVSNGHTPCTGDNKVLTSDISLLGAHYGSQLSEPDDFACLDIGPTTTNYIDGRPMPDDLVDFDDLILFAINYFVSPVGPSLVSRADGPKPRAVSAIGLAVGVLPDVGGTFDVVLRLESAGDVQAVSARINYDPAVVEPIGVSEGELLSWQAGPALALSPEPGTVDAAVFGRDLAIVGSGVLANVTFRFMAPGAPCIALGAVRARDTHNRPLVLERIRVTEVAALPKAVELAAGYPNPFTRSTMVALALPRTAAVKLSVCDVQGRVVNTLLNGTVSAGWSRVTWGGTSASGVRAAPGVYMMRLAVEGRVITRTVLLLR